MRKSLCLLVLVIFTLTPGATALELPAVISHHMVLQRGMPAPVWGKAAPGAAVTVRFGDAEVSGHADEAGDWLLRLPAMEASAEPRELVVEEAGVVPITLRDVLVGDVWHCSGQSNMEWTVRNAKDAEAEIAAADFPLIRHLTVPRTASDTPRFDSGGQWKVTSPETVGNFSAVGYYFGRKLHASQGVPIGLVGTAWGGASAEAYTSLPTLLADARTTAVVEQMHARTPEQAGSRQQHTTAALWHGMIHPVAPFAHRGVIWYQGESNRGRGEDYGDLLTSMIEDWRTLWDQPGAARNTPFLIVQLASYKQPHEQPPATDGWAEVCLGQAAAAAATDHAWIATAIDLGNAKDIHPRNKQDVGLRLARLAEHHVYGDESVVPVGPTFWSMEPGPGAPGRYTILWEHAEGLTTTDGEPPRGFAIRQAGGGDWVWAEVELSNQAVTIRHPDKLHGPFEVRYAYGINPADGPHGVNLVNGAGLPAMPFHIDDGD